eukprot:SAG11_NODE_553_length_8575_cov_18.074328_3_plen_196_part_00
MEDGRAALAAQVPVIRKAPARVSLADHPKETDAERAHRLSNTATLAKIPDFSELTRKLSVPGGGALSALSYYLAAIGDIEKAADKAVSAVLRAEAEDLLKDSPIGETDDETNDEKTPGAAEKRLELARVRNAKAKSDEAHAAKTANAKPVASKPKTKPAAAESSKTRADAKPKPALTSRSGRSVKAPEKIYDPDE